MPGHRELLPSRSAYSLVGALPAGSEGVSLMSHKPIKESKKKPQHTIKEKRAIKHQKKHPEGVELLSKQA
jgi:hypothetical protein